MWCVALSADAPEDVCEPAVVRPPFADAGLVMPAASATAAAVATVAAHALFTCLRKVPPSEVAGHTMASPGRGWSRTHARTPRITEYAEG
ncbi:hypothetical protein GCM10010340_10190 [Streptomyces griseoloalbus]|nr:hypothetical protein GCM10010294_18070 [Streptomyces griseoloalbus]GGW34297.1 hypothetical protein GCM10010340_10190 [Streptomyces albaduncus]